MKQKLRWALLLLLALFILLQFWPGPEIESHTEPLKSDFLLSHHQLDLETVQFLKAACYDCHSMNSHLPWYAYVSPASRLVREHIKNGRHELNFSLWSDKSQEMKTKRLKWIIHEIERNTMPLNSYLRFHPEARIDGDQRQRILSDLKRLYGQYQLSESLKQ